MHIPRDAVTVGHHGAARMRLADLELVDAFTVGNSLFGGGPPPVPASVSFDVRWAGGGGRPREVVDAGNRFAGRFVEGPATIVWSGQEDGFRFDSDPASASSTRFGAVGRERNGRFFGRGGDRA